MIFLGIFYKKFMHFNVLNNVLNKKILRKISTKIDKKLPKLIHKDKFLNKQLKY
jgi:hypothetical protein